MIFLIFFKQDACYICAEAQCRISSQNPDGVIGVSYYFTLTDKFLGMWKPEIKQLDPIDYNVNPESSHHMCDSMKQIYAEVFQLFGFLKFVGRNNKSVQ